MLFTFLMGLLTVIWVDVILSGDNAVVIALACHHLPASQQKWGMILGGLGAVFLRIACTGSVAWLMELPTAKLFGGTFLLYVAIKMLLPEDDEADSKSAKGGLLSAVGTIILADIMMSADNVVAVAAAANGSFLLMVIGLALSIPLIMFGASVISTFIEKFPILKWASGGLLGWIAGEMMITDALIPKGAQMIFHLLPFLGVAIVLVLGFFIPKLETSDA